MCEIREVQPQDPAVLLEAEHAVARVLAQGVVLPRVYPRLLEAMGTALHWDVAAAWDVGDDGTMACVATWAADGVDSERFEGATRVLRLGRGEGLPGRVWRLGRPARIADLAADANFPRAEAARAAGLCCALALPVRADLAAR